MNSLYPLKFKPIFKDKIWGGSKVNKVFGMDYTPLPNCGEAWILSGVEGFQSVVANGFLAGNSLNELVEVYMQDLVGDTVFEKQGTEFPVLIKFIDSKDWLSIQVHPDDKLAAQRNLGNGKTEMWYVMDADKDAELISGFNQVVDKESYLHHLEEKNLNEILNFEKVKKGDVFFMPAGRVHALGPGVFLAEIQQTSDTTYRIYDWDRIQADGSYRDLHIEEALDAIDFKLPETYKTPYKLLQNQSSPLVQCPYFTTNLIELDQGLSKDYTQLDSFVVYICLEGVLSMKYQDGAIDCKPGECVLIPADLKRLQIFPDGPAKLLEVYII